jgi:hypothetical protein
MKTNEEMILVDDIKEQFNVEIKVYEIPSTLLLYIYKRFCGQNRLQELCILTFYNSSFFSLITYKSTRIFNRLTLIINSQRNLQKPINTEGKKTQMY